MPIVIKFKLFIIISLVFIEVLAFQRKAFAQAQKGKKNENVFLHPKKFYKKFFPKLKMKPNATDTAYIKPYPNYFSVGVNALSPSIEIDIIPKSASSTGASKFRTNIADIVGFNMSYKFISAGFSFLLNSGIQTHEKYAKSQYRTATIKYSSRAWSFQFKFLRFKGLTDVNSENNPDPLNGYIRRPDIVNKEFQIEGLYNPGWKKYSCPAPFAFSQQLVKSRVGLLLKAGVFYTQLFGDSPLITPSQQQYYDDFNHVNTIRTLSIKIAPGVGGNLVILRRFYLSMAVFPSYDLFLYKYLNDPDEKVKGKQTFVFVLDGNASLGYQSKRFYAGLRYEIERKRASLYHIKTNRVYTYIGMELGYRFNTPKVVKKVYKETMPPGM